jgi:hypothetical protein
MNRLVMNGKYFLAVVLLTVLTGCSYPGAHSEKEFVGRWNSTKWQYPIRLYENGEWEVISDTGKVLQYGVWQVTGISDNQIMWSYKAGNSIHHVRDKILTASSREFTLRDGYTSKVTTFRRI